MKKTSILIIEDNWLLREGISAILNKQPDMIVSAALGNAENIVSIMEQFKPAIVLLDLGLRTQNSLALVKSIRKNYHKSKIIIMDLVPIEQEVFEFVQAGVLGFTLKDSSIDDFLQTIRSVIMGEKILPPYLTNSLFSQIVEQAIKTPKLEHVENSTRMTKNERQVIELIAEGISNKEIGTKLHLSEQIIKGHIHNILEKLSLHSRIQISNLYVKDSVQMTKREDQVIELITEGLSNKEIGTKLHLSPHTIKSHVHNILKKLSFNTRIQISNYSRNSK